LYIHFTATTTNGGGGGGGSPNHALFFFPTKAISTRIIPFHISENIRQNYRHW
jgi:hypothetical protein